MNNIEGDSMKQLPLVIIAVSIIIICFLNTGLVSALEPEEASVTLEWSSQTVYQGSIVNVVMTFHNNAADEITLDRVGLNFDWMSSDEFAGHDYSASPISVPAGGSQTFDAVTITVSNNTSAGEHSYFVGVDGSDSFGDFVWDSPEFTIEILSSGQKSFMDLLQRVQEELNEALNVTYESPEAQSLLQQAEDAYTQANLDAGAGNYSAAITTLENMSSYLDQAEVAEQQYAEQMAQQQKLILIAAIVAIVVVVVVVIALVWRSRNKNKPKLKKVPMKEEVTISSVAFSGGDTVDIAVDNSGTMDFAIAEVWINNEKQSFTTTPSMERIPQKESVHVSVTYAYSTGSSYNVKIISDRKKVYLVTATAL
jgi:hypothetical protein